MCVELMRIEAKLKNHISSKIKKGGFIVDVEAYYGFNGSTMCRVQLFEKEWNIEKRQFKYEDRLDKNFCNRLDRKLSKRFYHMENVKAI